MFVVDGGSNELQAHGVDLAGRRLDPLLDLVQGEGVIGALVPIAFAVDAVKIESGGFGGQSPVVALGTVDPPHDFSIVAALAATAVAAMSMAVALHAETAA